MQERYFGDTTWLVPELGQGTWYREDDDRESAIAALRRGLDLGLTHIDTAEMYLDGTAEEWVGEAIAGRRKEVFLVSKVLPQNATRTGTVIACERSLRRLCTDVLDCYLLHWRGRYPLSETVAGFEQLQREGKIRSWGVSNFDVGDLRELQTIAGKRRPICNQVLYHLQQRAIEHAVLPWCEHHRVAVVGYSPFGHGQFPEPRTQGGRLLRTIADDHQATPRQVALRFLLRDPAVLVIPKATNPEHVQENSGAGSLSLTPGELERIDEAFPVGPPPRELPML